MAKEAVFSNGLKMPLVGLGTWPTTDEEARVAVDAALEKGYRHIDTAHMYKNEEAIGKVLKKWLDSGRVRREELFIVTKLPINANRASCVEKYLRRSLERLQLSYVDLFLIHQPVGLIERGDELFPTENGKPLLDFNTDHISLWKAMEEQVDAGRVKSIGLSNFNARQIKRIVQAARIKPANLQVELHLYFQRKELVAFCKALDITVCAYSPIGSPGLLELRKKMGVDTSRIPDLNPIEDPIVKRLAEKYKKTPAQILLRHLTQKGIAVVPKSVKPARIEENFQVFDFILEGGEINELDMLDKGRNGRRFGIGFGFEDHPEYPYNDPY